MALEHDDDDDEAQLFQMTDPMSTLARKYICLFVLVFLKLAPLRGCNPDNRMSHVWQ